MDSFYNRKYGEFARRLRLLYDRYGMASKVQGGIDKQDMEDLMNALAELRGNYRKLLWYGEVNRRGFVKITKKLNKKIPSSTAQSRYLTTKVDPKQFASNNKLSQDMRSINDWLSALAEIKIHDDSSSVHSGSSGSLRRMGSRAALKVSSADLEAMEHAARIDDVERLTALLREIPATAPSQALKNLELDLLQRAISHRALKCIKSLLQKLPSVDQEDDMNKRNCLHRLVISIGRARAEGMASIPNNSAYINAAVAPTRALGALNVEERDPNIDLGKDQQAEQLLIFILDNLSADQRPAILSKDIHGRMPLHHAAEYGLAAVCISLMEHMQAWDVFNISDGLDSAEWQDDEGYAPYHLAVMKGHFRTVKALLLVGDSHTPVNTRLTSRHVEKSGASLALATRSNYYKIVQLLVDAGIDLNHQDEHGATALYVAADAGHDECAAILLEGSNDQSINLELAEDVYGWTPLFAACTNGYTSIVKLLISKGADPTKVDKDGYSAQEHAALRGHLDIMRYLAQFLPAPSMHASPALVPQDAMSRPKSSLFNRRPNGFVKDHVALASRGPEPVKEFGHRYIQDESMVLVSLGSLDERKSKAKVPIKLDNIELAKVHSTRLDTALTLYVSAQGASSNGAQGTYDLPIQESVGTSPLTFTSKNPENVKLLFDLVPTYAGNPEKAENRVARGVALLSSIKTSVGNMRMSLQGDFTVPLISATTLDVIGEVNFTFLIIRPFKHPNMAITEGRTYWKKSSTMVIGHRGMGKNMNAKTSLQLGENTMQSFITAANLGASYVEFDVQMTKDLVPVLYHDFLVSETGADIPVHTLTSEQFLALKNESTPRVARTPSPSRVNTKAGNMRLQRSYSVDARDIQPDTRDRMKHTRDFKEKGFKGNSRGDSIQQPFATLEEALRKVPVEAGFNIEMKYPMLFESEEQGMDTYAVELNSFVDIVLKMVYDLGGERNIIFSSFHPDICLLLSFKQPSIPVLFLTDAGTSEVGDVRASSLQEAIRFASRWKLLGIVSASEPFIMCPRLIPVVKDHNLVCFSYGTLNNITENSRLQKDAGIDAVIVDSVSSVWKGLIEPIEHLQIAAPDEPDGVPEANGGLQKLVELTA